MTRPPCKSSNTFRLAMLGMALSMSFTALATPVVIQNGYVKAGVSDYGTLGSNGNVSPGILFDSTGTANYGINDFLTPGTPFEGFYINFTTATGTGTFGSNNTASPQDFGSNSPTLLTGTSATWTGSNGFFSITNDYNLTTLGGQSVIAITTTLTNISNDPLAGIQFLRTLDPDPDANAYGSYYTTNVVLSDNQACGTGPSTGLTICIYSFETGIPHKAGVSSSWSTDPADYLAGVNDGNGDWALGIAFSLGDLAAGQSISFNYGYSLGAIPGNTTGVPEPASLALLGLGLAGLGAMRRRQAA